MVDKTFLSFIISTTALILILLTGPIILQQGQDTIKTLSRQIQDQSDTNGRYINISLDNINNMSHKLDVITQRLNGSN